MRAYKYTARAQRVNTKKQFLRNFSATGKCVHVCAIYMWCLSKQFPDCIMVHKAILVNFNLQPENSTEPEMC